MWPRKVHCDRAGRQRSGVGPPLEALRQAAPGALDRHRRWGGSGRGTHVEPPGEEAPPGNDGAGAVLEAPIRSTRAPCAGEVADGAFV
ncbi:MAG: hypothetical protein Kow0092_35970 [Deferrisomatales bacterium]